MLMTKLEQHMETLKTAILEYEMAINSPTKVYRHEHILELFYRARAATEWLEDLGGIE